jgi:cell division protein FtsI (penicillin-binding protein 3)
LKKAKARSIELKISGNGWASSQYPQAGTPLGEDRVCSVTFALSH